MTQREDFESFKLRGNSKYKPHDDSISDRHDWVVWQAAQAAQPVANELQLVKNLMEEYGLQALDFVEAFKKAQPVGIKEGQP